MIGKKKKKLNFKQNEKLNFNLIFLNIMPNLKLNPTWKSKNLFLKYIY